MSRLLTVALATAAAAGGATLVADGAAGAATKPQVRDVDADVRWDGRLRLEAETAGASRVTFRYRGRTYRARVVDVDREDGTRDWARTVKAKRAHRRGGTTVRVKVRACSQSGCVTRTSREYLERPERDDD
jgi:hypothetical protein